MNSELELDQLKRAIKRKLKVKISLGVTLAPMIKLVVKGNDGREQLIREQLARIDFGQWATSEEILVRIPHGRKPFDPGTYEIDATWAIDGFVLGRLRPISQQSG